jgi:hypothetical protein
MRSTAFIAAMVCALAVAPARAQRGGARMGGAPARSVGAMHMAPGPSRGMAMSPHGQSWNSFHSGFHGCPGCFNPHHHHGSVTWWNRGFGSSLYGYGLGYSYYPSLWDSSSSYRDQDSSYESERYLTRQIDELNQELQRVRQEQEERAYESAQVRPQESSPPVQAAARTPAESRKDLPTILVYRDQHIQEVQNYAIAGKNLVVVADRRSTKIPLEKLDLAATAKLNDERGVDFQMPR